MAKLVKSRLYQYLVLWHPTSKQSEEGEKSEMVVEPTYILSDSDQFVQTVASRKIPKEYDDKLDQIEIVIVPFHQG